MDEEGRPYRAQWRKPLKHRLEKMIEKVVSTAGCVKDPTDAGSPSSGGDGLPEMASKLRAAALDEKLDRKKIREIQFRAMLLAQAASCEAGDLGAMTQQSRLIADMLGMARGGEAPKERAKKEREPEWMRKQRAKDAGLAGGAAGEAEEEGAETDEDGDEDG